MVFLPRDKKEPTQIEDKFKKVIQNNGLSLLGWRDIPTDDSQIGKTAKETEPVIRHLFIGRPKEISDELSFERRLYITRKEIENWVRACSLKQKNFFISVIFPVGH